MQVKTIAFNFLRLCSRKSTRYAALVVFVCIACNLFTYNKIFPLTGGFYSVAAKSMSAGLLPYKDFQLLFPPVYVYIVHFITSIFGYDFIALRIFGVVLFAIEALLLFIALNKLFNEEAALFGSIVGMFLLQSSNAFTAYDYARIHDLFVLVAFLQFLEIIRSEGSKSAVVRSLAMGICMGLAIGVRQSSGVLIASAFLIACIAACCLRKEKRYWIQCSMVYVAGLAAVWVIIAALMMMAGMWEPFLSSAVTDAASAKGGLLTALFAWIPASLERLWKNQTLALPYLLLVSLIAGCQGVAKTTKRQHAWTRDVWAWVPTVFCVLLFVGMIVSYWDIDIPRDLSAVFSYEIPYLVFLVQIAVLLPYLIGIIKRAIDGKEAQSVELERAAIQGVSLAVVWGGGMSSSLGFQTCYIPAALFVSWAIFKLNEANFGVSKAIVVAASAVLCLLSFNIKIYSPYSWWGMDTGTAADMLYTVDLPYMNGMYVTKSAKDSLEGTQHALDEVLDEGDSLFCFPQNPLSYLFNDKMPFTYSYIQWFDVSSDGALISDMEAIKKEKPEALVIELMPESTFAGHEAAFRDGNTSYQRIMQDELAGLIERGNYSLVTGFDEGNGYYLGVFARDFDGDAFSNGGVSDISGNEVVYGGGSGTQLKWNSWLVVPLLFDAIVCMVIQLCSTLLERRFVQNDAGSRLESGNR